jgi:ATP-binding cassette subfamily F protein 3
MPQGTARRTAVTALGRQIREMEAAMCEPMEEDAMTDLLERYGNVQAEFEHRGGYDLESRAQVILTGLGIGPDDYHHPVESFSGGWKMRIALAKILSINPDVLLLDEPTNYLDVESIIWLDEWLSGSFKAALRNFSGTVVLVSHDRHFLRCLIDRVFEIDHGRMRTYNGHYEYYLETTGREHRAA